MLMQYALKEIRRRKLRSSVNIIGYAIAIAFLVVTVALAQGYSCVAAGTLNGIGTHFVVYVPASQTCPCQFGDVGPFFKVSYTPTFNLSVIEKIRELPGVADAAPCMMFKLDNLTICGVDFASLATKTNVVSPDEIVKGSYLNANDSSGVMVDSVFAELAKLDVDDSMAAFGRNFTVVGVVNPSLHSKPAGIANMYAPLSVVQEIARHYANLYNFAVRDANVILVEIAPQGDSQFINTVQQSVLSTLESYAGQAGALVGYQCGFTARKVVLLTEDSAWAISGVLLVCVTLFSLRSQFGSVIERTKEIGVLKAIGWTDLDITKQVFLESLLQGIAGGVVGLILAYVVTIFIPQLGIFPTQNLVFMISPLLVIFGFAASLFGGIIAGVFPAWHVAKLQPAEALRRF
jgi:putative ABC transport system permease protein